MLACITAAKSHDSHGSLQIIQVATYKVRGSSEHQAGPAEHKAILQHCEPDETCLLSLFHSLVATHPDAGQGLESETTLRQVGRERWG